MKNTLFVVFIVCLLLMQLSMVALACGECGVEAGYTRKCLNDAFTYYGSEGEHSWITDGIKYTCYITIWGKHHELYCKYCRAAISGSMALHGHERAHRHSKCLVPPVTICPYL